MGTTPTVQDNTVCITVSTLWLDEPTEALKGYVGLTMVGWCDNLLNGSYFDPRLRTMKSE